MVERDQLRDAPAQRQADEVGALEPEAVEQADGVGGQVAHRVRLVRDERAGAAEVVADDEPAGVRQPPAERLVPVEHRAVRPVGEHDRGVAGGPERLGVEVLCVCIVYSDSRAHENSSPGVLARAPPAGEQAGHRRDPAAEHEAGDGRADQDLLRWLELPAPVGRLGDLAAQALDREAELARLASIDWRISSGVRVSAIRTDLVARALTACPDARW